MPQVVCWTILVGIALRVFFFFIGENAGGDALARAAMTAGWLKHPSFRLIFGPYLPFDFWLMAGMSLLVGNVGLGARLLSLFLGIGSLAIFWAVARQVYGASAAKLSLLVFAFYSLHVGYSTTSSSEVPYLFFVLTGLLGFFVYRQSGSASALALGAVSLGIGGGIRYEAWLFIFAIFVVLLLFPSDHAGVRFGRSGYVGDVTLFSGIAGSWPFFWMIYQWKLRGMPLYGITMNYKWVPEQLAEVHKSQLYHLALFPGVILLTLTPVILVAGLYGLGRGLCHRQRRDFCLIFLIVGVITSFQIAAGGLLPMARYTITLGSLLAMASGYGVEQFARFLPQRRVRHLSLGICFLLVLNLGGIFVLSLIPNRFSDKFGSISPALRFPQRIESLGRYLKPRVDLDTAVVIDDYNTEGNLIAHVIGLPLLAGDRAYFISRNDLPGLLDYIKKKHPRYLIYSNRGVLRRFLPLPEQCGAFATKNIQLGCLFQNDIYRVYSIGYEPSPANSAKSMR
ncbi:MAG TPA: glycosyltransferase family 39 protein [Terriglobia bacterium]|nr:glycosyltransferase family 39 protein [Terriglobia bacterium]